MQAIALQNNLAERDICIAKVNQHVSECFRTPQYAATHCRISSYSQSMARQSCNPLTAIQIAFNGKAATMIANPTQNNHAKQAPGGE